MCISGASQRESSAKFLKKKFRLQQTNPFGENICLVQRRLRCKDVLKKLCHLVLTPIFDFGAIKSHPMLKKQKARIFGMWMERDILIIAWHSGRLFWAIPS